MTEQNHTWVDLERPGFFGRRRDAKIAALNAKHGEGSWRLVWRYAGEVLDFETACVRCYEESYYRYLQAHPDHVNFITSHYNVIDNAPTNVNSGFDYTIQEAYSTHIQDIAIRSALFRLGCEFTSSDPNNILIVRGEDTRGWRYNPGNVPFFAPEFITSPSLRPSWAQLGSVEDFWQSNKWIQTRSVP